MQPGHASIGGTFRAGQVHVSQATATTVPVIGNNTAVGAGTSVGGSFTSAQQSGIGVRGTAVATVGRANGVYGESRSAGGAGVYGKSTTRSNFADEFAAGVLGESVSSSVPGVMGFSTVGAGVYGTTLANGSAAITAFHQGTSGSGIHTFGPTGIFASGGVPPFGVGIDARGANGGTFSVVNNGNGTACRGSNAMAVSTGFGVYGRHFTNNGFAVFAEGKTGATGTKSFVIDHPFDPTNKTLSHYCTEGEEPLNVYRGRVVTDARGEAWVRLPDYFEEINTEPTVQLTVSDSSDSFVMAKVAREVSGGRFLIRTSKPGAKVFWRVEARRNDRWMQAYGAPVEAEKPDFVRGTYMRPELYGKPQSMSEDARRFPAIAEPKRPGSR
ncbi:MAG: hypothetical protein IT207_11085 [Fimbriimonadaceae bacterium]|nr:hypothetical protein [Fimbriimonadaceae bacterium]